MTALIWICLSVQILMGAIDTLYHHELTERLAWRTNQADELKLHAVRNLAYAITFIMLAFWQPMGSLQVDCSVCCSPKLSSP